MIHLVVSPQDGQLDERAWSAPDLRTRDARVGKALDEGLAALDAATADRTPPAVICCNDEVGLGVLRIIAARGLRPGVDIGVIGFDNSAEAAASGLSSLAPPMPAMGGETARLCLRLLAGEDVPRRTLLPWVVVERASTAPG